MTMKRTYLYCDTEFNGFGGELISLALVNPEDGSCWYGIKDLTGMEFHPWVAEHVIPKLRPEIGGEYENYTFRNQLWQYIKPYVLEDHKITIVADWPEDLGHFASHMCWEGGQRPRVNFDLRLISSKHQQVTDPHNALADAWDLGNWCHANKDKWE
jgi:hypothetical protein